jgi:hypothetical protein
MFMLFSFALSAALGLSASAQDDDLMPEDVDQLDVMQNESPAPAEEYGAACCDAGCCSCGSFYGEVQYLRFNTFATEGNFEGLDNEEGYRIIAGYQCCDGLGVRVRWFDFEGAQQTGTVATNTGLDLEYADLEITNCFCLCDLHGVVSAGYRHAEYDAFTNDAIGNPDESFDGDGVTLGIQLEREICCGVGAFLWAQHSMLYGDDNGTNNDDDVVMGWTEAQLGVQYSTCLAGYHTVVSGGVEAQRHEGMFNANTQDTGLLGWFLSAGVQY